MTRGTIGAVLAATAVMAQAADLELVAPESQGVSSRSVGAFVARLDAADGAHAFLLMRNGKVIAQGAWRPYELEMPHALYDASAAFVAMGTAFAVEAGRLSLDDRVERFFPKAKAAAGTAGRDQLRVRDLMTMSSGQRDDAWPAMMSAVDGGAADAFLGTPVATLPGTAFRYYYGNAAMLAEVLRSATGCRDLSGYLDEPLFRQMGIRRHLWRRQANGTVLGASGLELSAIELARVAQMMLQHGRWDGRQVVPEWWIAQATVRQIPFGGVLEPTLWSRMREDSRFGSRTAKDWSSGFGYQLWRGRRNSYRMDGAHGQLAVVVPEEQVVFVMLGGGKALNQAALDALFAMLGDKSLPEELPADERAVEELRGRCAALAIKPPAGGAKPSAATVEAVGKGSVLAENPLGIRRLKLNAETGECKFENEFGVQGFVAGIDGGWRRGEVELESGQAAVDRFDRVASGMQPIAASVAWTGDCEGVVRICFLRSAATVDVVLTVKDGVMAMRTEGSAVPRYNLQFEAKAPSSEKTLDDRFPMPSVK